MAVYENIEKPLIKVIADMEVKGIKVDKKSLQKLSKEFEYEIVELQNRIYIQIFLCAIH